MCAGHKNAHREIGPFGKEIDQPQQMIFRQDRESRKRVSFASVKGRRDSPYTAPAISQFQLFFIGKFQQSVRRICHDCVNGIRRPPCHPIKAISQIDFACRKLMTCDLRIHPVTTRCPGGFHGFVRREDNRCIPVNLHAISTINEKIWLTALPPCQCGSACASMTFLRR